VCPSHANAVIDHVQQVPAVLSSIRNRVGSTNLIRGIFSNNANIPNFHNPSSSRLSKANIDKPNSKECSTVSDVSTLSVPVPSASRLCRDKGVSFDLPVTRQDIAALPSTNPDKNDSFSSPPQTFDDQGLVVTPVFSGADVIMTDATITSPHPIASIEESFLSGSPTHMGKSDAEILEDMMTSERGDCSNSPDLFIEDAVPIIPASKPVRERRTNNSLFPISVPIITGQSRVHSRAARALATMLSEE
jgi:hypothetical protein